MKKTIRILNRCLLVALSLLVAVLLLSTAIQKIHKVKLPMTFGWGNAVILTGSMEPTIPTKSWVLIHATNDYQVGDIIAFQQNDDIPIIHRILAIQGDMITTKGDANNIQDPQIARTDVLGEVVLVLPPAMMPAIFFSMLGIAAIVVITEQIQLIRYKKYHEERTEEI